MKFRVASCGLLVAILLILPLLLLSVAGCGGLRFAPTENIKDTAYLQAETAKQAAAYAKAQAATDPVLNDLLASLEQESNVFLSYTGFPDTLPATKSLSELLGQANQAAVTQAAAEAPQRPGPEAAWAWADAGLDLTDGVLSVLGLGGIALAVRRLRAKGAALREVVTGNELYKQWLAQTNQADSIAAFKAYQYQQQSTATEALVSAERIKLPGTVAPPELAANPAAGP